MVPEDVAMLGQHRRQHLSQHAVLESLTMPSDIEKPNPRDLLADPLRMAAHRGGYDQASDLGRSVHRVAQAQIWMAERLAQSVRIALITIHLEVIVRRRRRAMLANYQRSGDYAPS